MADLKTKKENVKSKVEASETGKVKNTTKKTVALDPPKDVAKQIQIHQGNIGILTVQLLSRIIEELRILNKNFSSIKGE